MSRRTQIAFVLAGAGLTACGAPAPADPSSWLGDACGVPDLAFTVSERDKRLTLGEHRVQGTVRTEDGLGTAPATDRQRLIERAMPCIEREAARRGLRVEYPIMHVDG